LLSARVGPDVDRHDGKEAAAAMDEVMATSAEAVADVTDGSSLAVGGFGFCGRQS
jgi:acyl-CoA hydrolase